MLGKDREKAMPEGEMASMGEVKNLAGECAMHLVCRKRISIIHSAEQSLHTNPEDFLGHREDRAFMST